MKANPKPHHDASTEASYQSECFRGSAAKRHLVIALCFIAGGWALLSSGHNFWGFACIAMAVLAPPLFIALERYQQRYPAVVQAKQERETQQLIERARQEMDADNAADAPNITR